jgi:methylaspartate mutase sigma subunit
MTAEIVRSGRAARRLDVVVTSLSSDAHTWNLIYLQLLLEEMGCTVTNLGATTPDEVILARCEALRPDLVVISSLNGHGCQDGVRLIERIRANPGLADLPVVIGGRLDTTAGADGMTTKRLLAAGFDAVFEDGRGITSFRTLVGGLARHGRRALPDERRGLEAAER